MKTNAHKRLKGFTIVEVLVVLALTSLSVSLSYGALNATQELFSRYKAQNRFLNEFTELKRRCDYEALKAISIIEIGTNIFEIKRDSLPIKISVLDKRVLLFKGGICDTFHLEAKNLKIGYEEMANPLWQNKLVNELSFDVEFSKQKYIFSFTKSHDASVKLALDSQENGGKY
ncbi:MAG: prepilin-type N-terminal cleavage/methylation domain-containing protein [Bacteroidia bacterium]|nr:prepilin-type N-terminal cleavage/methylation domain-containing protein [Bacteroidia bacterium]